MSAMVGDHVETELIAAFVDGGLGEHTATLVARHLDVCPACANLARELDPLADVFASMDDPMVPDDLVMAILAADAAAEATPVGSAPWTELIVGSGMLAVAAMVLWPFGDGAVVIDRLHTLGVLASAASTHASAQPLVLSTLAMGAVLAATAALVSARLPATVGLTTAGGPR